MKKLLFTFALICTQLALLAQFRYADIEMKLISHEQNVFIKGPYQDTLTFEITNLGPDTIKQKDTFVFAARDMNNTSQAVFLFSRFGLDYDLPMGVSFRYKYPIEISTDKDFYGPIRFTISRFTKDPVGDPLRDESEDQLYNNVVRWNITYRSATSSIPAASRVSSTIYPNPTNGSLYLQTDAAVRMIKAELFDLSGRMVFSSELNGLNSEQIDLSGLKNGIYQLQIHTSEGVSLQKVVLNN